MTREERMAMVSKEDKLSIRQQCLLLGLCRTSLYYTPSEETPENLEIMRLLDRQYAITPFYGQRRLLAWLETEGYCVNIKRLWRSVKQEYVYLNPCDTGDELWRGLNDYFRFYNEERLHQSLGYRTPDSFYTPHKEAA